MKKLILTVLLASLTWLVNAAELKWTTDLPAAQAKAKAEKKMVFMNFTGSDWCGWCIKLDKDVFSKPEFIKFAEKNLVMVTVDFPSKKKLEPEQKKANDALKAKYQVKGFPTLIVLNGKGDKVYEKVGYMGDVQKWLSDLEAAKQK